MFSQHVVRHLDLGPCTTGVSDQPFGDAETRLGAMNRAKAAYDAAAGCTNDKNENCHPDFAVGLEGGLERQCHPQMRGSSEEDRRNSHEDNGNTPCDADKT